MRLQYGTMEKVTGAFIVLTLVILVFTATIVGRGKNWFRKHVTYYTTFEEGYNLVSGSRVKLFGTDVGKVTDVRLTEDNAVRIEFEILAAYASRIRTDSTAVVESPTFIGSEYIAITPGSPAAPFIPPEGEIPSRERKKLGEYLEEYELEKKLKQLGNIIADLAELTSELKRSEGPLLGTLGNLRQLTAAIEAGEGTLGRMIRSDELYQLIKEELEAISLILAAFQKTVDHSVQISANVEMMSENLVPATDQATQMTEKVQELLDRMLRVSVLMEKAMSEVPDISRQAREGMREVNIILDSVKENFLVRPYLPPPTTPESHGLEIRGD
ncbi:MAG: MCE family protein [Deltaproteobacteria bacterium]|nr:MAG: MCE family protein [Deltaproteobacteria bacterium]